MRRSNLDLADTLRLIVAFFALIGLLWGFRIALDSDIRARPMAVNGDSLGREHTETLADYIERAEQSLEHVQEEPVFALVSFKQPLSPEDAAAVADSGVRRVNAVIGQSLIPVGVVEPAGGFDRVQVFEHATKGPILGLVVYGSASELESLAEFPQVLAVEASYPDAVWGNIGIRPVIAASEDAAAPVS